jgi:chorismate mutase
LILKEVENLMTLQGVRGAINVADDTPKAIYQATQQLLEAILHANPEMHPEDLGSVIFSTTEDLTSAYPAQAAREMGWSQVPLLCLQEMQVEGSMTRIIRVLIHWNRTQTPDSIQHVYLGNAAQLRRDLTGQRRDE